MNAVRNLSHRWHLLRSTRQVGLSAGLTGAGLALAGCAAAAGFGAALLTGLFIGRLATSLQATAHSYEYSDTGNVGMQFGSPAPGAVSLNRFFGRLPGFHIVFIHLKQGTTLQGEEEAIVYDTDVNIDFTTSPPTLSGAAVPRDGGESLPLEELYPQVAQLRAEIGEPDAEGTRRLALILDGRNPSGDEIEYTLIFNVGFNAATGVVTGSVEIERSFTPVDGEPVIITGSGTLRPPS